MSASLRSPSSTATTTTEELGAHDQLVDQPHQSVTAKCNSDKSDEDNRLQPAFQYNASLHPIETTSPQAHSSTAPHSAHSPLSAGLRLETNVAASMRHEANAALEVKPQTTDIRSQQESSKSGIPVRSTSVRSALSATSHAGDALSPASARSSPALGPFADMTPLPSPLATGGSPGPWRQLFEATDTSSPNLANGALPRSTPVSDEVESESLTHESVSPTKRKAYASLVSTSPVVRVQEQERSHSSHSARHSRNRSQSEYVPETIQAPRARNVVVSGSKTPTTVERMSTPQPMHREEYLAAQRGIVPQSTPRPPTPPRSNRSLTDESDLESPPLRPKEAKGPLPMRYEARSIRNGKLRQWVAVRQLGMGTFSTVMLATSEGVEAGHALDPFLINQKSSMRESEFPLKSLVAVKICEHGPAGGADEKKIESSLKREIDILKSIDHPSLVHLKAVNVLNRRAFLILNYSAGGDLFELASLKLDLLVPSLVRRIFGELVMAVRYLHSQYIVHRDIKLENVLVNIHTDNLPSVDDWQAFHLPVITLTDLGLGRWIPRPPESPLLDTRCGSEDYAAPELLMGQEYDGRSTDAWALGVLLYAIIEGRLPFDPVPGARRQRPISHRIASCEWSWVKRADEDGEWDPTKGKDLEGGRECVEGLLRRTRTRWDLEKVEALEWVKGAVEVPGGLRRLEDDDERVLGLRWVLPEEP